MRSFRLSAIAGTAVLLKGVHCLLIHPYIDPQCTKPVRNVTLDGSPAPSDLFNDPLALELGSIQGPIQSPVFHGAENKDAPGYNVYWKIEDLDFTCAVALMQEYSQFHYGLMPEPLPPGNVILMTNTPGCVYSFVPVNFTVLLLSIPLYPSNLYMQNDHLFNWAFCCGTGDCSALSPGDAALYKRAPEVIVICFR